ncbi:MAG: DNA-deoxyinosine glycosylase [Bacteroidales bacterium]
MTHKKEGFLPVIDEQTRILILGTLPSDTSLRTGEYYANPQNQFWRIIFSLYNNGQAIISYDKKCELILKNKLGLWDVLKHANRFNSLDSSIHMEKLNDFDDLFSKYPNIRKLIFNGQNAATYYQRLMNRLLKKDMVVLPSTSSANTSKTFAQKGREWEMGLTF